MTHDSSVPQSKIQKIGKPIFLCLCLFIEQKPELRQQVRRWTKATQCALSSFSFPTCHQLLIPYDPFSSSPTISIQLKEQWACRSKRIALNLDKVLN